VLVVLMLALHRRGLVSVPVFAGMGVALWLALHASGVHATLAGVAMGLLAPARAVLDRDVVLTQTDELLDVYTPRSARTTSQLARLSVSRLEWLEHGLHPWSSLAVVPIFALANAGVSLSGDAISGAARSPVTLGVVVGLVAGKVLGITGASWLACRFGMADLAPGVRWRHLAGTACLGGIGFTVSLFITGLAFEDAVLISAAKVGILAACVVATITGAILLRGNDVVDLRARGRDRGASSAV
jgi:Na+:H+ antiporter, NhaA family